MDSPSVSPEPGSFPKRRPAAVGRITVPADALERGTAGLSSCHSDAPLPSATARRPRPSKPGYELPGPVQTSIALVVSILLLAALASTAWYRQRQLTAVVSAERKQHQDDMSLQVAWLSASMAEHDQCKAALTRADSQFQVTKISWQQCEAERKQKCDHAAEEDRRLTTQLQLELHWAQTAIKTAEEKLKAAEEQLSSTKLKMEQQQQLMSGQVESLQQQLKEEHNRQAQQLLEQAQHTPQVHQTGLSGHSAVSAVQEALAAEDAAHQQNPTAAQPPDGTASSSSSSNFKHTPMVVTTCALSDVTPNDVITPWCQAAVAAGVPHALVVTEEDQCVAAAKASGVKVLQHKVQVPGQLAGMSADEARSYRRYALLQQVLSLGHPVLSVQPEVLLLSDPLPLLQHFPTDVTLMATGTADSHIPYSDALNPAILYLKPQPAVQQFLSTMMQALVTGKHAEVALLRTLLLQPWQMHESEHAAATDSSSSGQAGDLVLPAPVTVGLLPRSLFVSSESVFSDPEPKAWLTEHQPVSVAMLSSESYASQVQQVLSWLNWEVQEVARLLHERREGVDTGGQALADAPSSGAASAAVTAAAQPSGSDGKGVPPTAATHNTQQGEPSVSEADTGVGKQELPAVATPPPAAAIGAAAAGGGDTPQAAAPAATTISSSSSQAAAHQVVTSQRGLQAAPSSRRHPRKHGTPAVRTWTSTSSTGAGRLNSTSLETQHGQQVAAATATQHDMASVISHRQLQHTAHQRTASALAAGQQHNVVHAPHEQHQQQRLQPASEHVHQQHVL